MKPFHQGKQKLRLVCRDNLDYPIHLQDAVEIIFVLEGESVALYEKKRISLGFKTEENDPWNIFKNNYNIGDVVDATVVSIMPFGAFAEIIPDLDGLIHISQISDKPVSNPASVLKVGDKVTVKITAADFEKRRLSLSIRALLEPEVAVEETAAEEIAAEETTEAAE